MKPRSDEEVAVAVWCERWGDTAAGSKPDETITEYEIALVAAGRAEGQSNENEACAAMVEAWKKLPGTDEFLLEMIANAIRARLREIEQ